MSTHFLDQVVAVWTAQPVLGVRYAIKRAIDNSKLIVEIEATQVLATIEAWESACLDITTLDLATKRAKIHSAGEIGSIDEMHRRLAELRDILCAYEVSGAA
jgi:hypothetical protein